MRLSSGRIAAEDAAGNVEEFDELVYACDAETALKTNAKPTWWVLSIYACSFSTSPWKLVDFPVPLGLHTCRLEAAA